MIDIFVEDIGDKECLIYFIQIGCFYKCKKNNIEALCDNVVSLYCSYNLSKYNEIEYTYLPVTIYNNLYKKESEILFEGEVVENIKYNVRKVC